jgi:hypothetical protein
LKIKTSCDAKIKLEQLDLNVRLFAYLCISVFREIVRSVYADVEFELEGRGQRRAAL